MRVKIGVIAVAAAAVVTAACGGSAGGREAGAMGAAAVAPGSAAAYVAVDSNLYSAAWTKAKALLDRFPGKDEFIAHLRSSLQQEGLDWETDVKPALGSEIDLVWHIPNCCKCFLSQEDRVTWVDWKHATTKRLQIFQ